MDFTVLHNTVFLQRPRNIVGDAGTEPGTSAPEVHCHDMSHYIIFNRKNICGAFFAEMLINFW